MNRFEIAVMLLMCRRLLFCLCRGEKPIERGSARTGATAAGRAALLVACVCVLLGQPAFAAEPADGEAEHDRIELSSGDVLLGRITEENDEQLTLEHPIFGSMTVERDQIAGIVRAPGEEASAEAADDAADADAAAMDEPASPMSDAEREAEEAEAMAEPSADADADTGPDPRAVADGDAEAGPDADPPEVEPEPRKTILDDLRDAFEDWRLELSLGVSDRSSNVRTFSINSRLDARYADDRDRWRIRAGYNRTTSNSSTTRNDVRVGVQKDWLLPDSSWFFFAQTDYQHDTIKSWRHRIGTHGGVGYDLEELLGIDARLRGGFGATTEIGGVDPKTRPESLMATEFNLQLTEIHSLAGTIQFIPTIDGSGYYRITSDVDWDIELTDELSLRFGLQHEYDNAVPAGFKKHDRRLTGSLVYRF